jgi:Ion channel
MSLVRRQSSAHADPSSQGAREEESSFRLEAILDRYDSSRSTSTAELRRAFLVALCDRPRKLEDRYARFLAEAVEVADLVDLAKESPSRVVGFCESVYASRFATEEMAERVETQVGVLLSGALHELEEAGRYEEMLRLLRYAPPSQALGGVELRRLRNKAHLYEMSRVRRNRRYLFGYLLSQVLLVGIVFPLLFIYAENGVIQKRIEEATSVELPHDKGHQYLSYSDGLYWSLITAGSIGYGDITPRTEIGRAIAAILGIMGVITAGVIAGLILSWVTPRFPG